MSRQLRQKVFICHTGDSITLICNGMKRPSIKPLTSHLPRDSKGEKRYFQYTSLTLKRFLFTISIFIWLGIYAIQQMKMSFSCS